MRIVKLGLAAFTLALLGCSESGKISDLRYANWHLVDICKKAENKLASGEDIERTTKEMLDNFENLADKVDSLKISTSIQSDNSPFYAELSIIDHRDSPNVNYASVRIVTSSDSGPFSMIPEFCIFNNESISYVSGRLKFREAMAQRCDSGDKYACL